ncbi:MAG TPA: hypothetical protein VHM64_08380 [Candidatus Binatia bacterium]|nr:hypothetical protein [Candidatus Binatia bacterium]
MLRAAPKPVAHSAEKNLWRRPPKHWLIARLRSSALPLKTLLLPQAKITQDHENNYNDADDVKYVSHEFLLVFVFLAAACLRAAARKKEKKQQWDRNSDGPQQYPADRASLILQYLHISTSLENRAHDVVVVCFSSELLLEPMSEGSKEYATEL